ncbi:MAG: Phenolic acid decarboxylase subunit C [Alphaproteobacteria bacterium MarineAlpha11_Bin1]|nr:MAG: Phenolic acid decarboxylase subunit C [Alphaproteobacteria bacterium MarineAlpha11_Bin1]
MRDQSLRAHVANLEQQGELIRITKEVDPHKNVSAIGWKAYDRLGKSTLFTNLRGFPGWEIVNQVITDRRKWSIALGIREEDLIPTLVERIKRQIEPVEVNKDKAPVKEVILKGSAADLTKVPALWHAEKDPSPYIASGMAIIKDPETGIRNMSIHRQQIQGPDQTGFLICPRHALRIYQKYQQRNEPMPVAMVIGAHPAIYYASGFTSSYGLDELEVAGSLLDDPVRLVKCETIDIEVPAEAEIIIEGEVLPDGTVEEGPFGEATGTYAMEGSTEIFKVKAITHRKDPMFYAMQCGAPMTDTQSITGTCIETVITDHLKNVEGGLDLLDVRCLGISGLMAIVLKLRPRVEGQAKTALMSALSSPYLHPKIAIAVDDDIDASDLRQIFWSMTTRVHGSQDVMKIPNTRIWSLDNVSDIVPGMSAMYRIGTKVIIDATKPAVTQADARSRFAPAMPFGHTGVNLEDYLP